MHDRAPTPDDFPAEVDWLTLPAPPISAEFVARTWEQIVAEQQLADPELSALLQHARVGPPSAGFVDATLARITMSRHTTPEPSAEFVDRVLGALREARPGRVFPRWRVAALAAAVLFAVTIGVLLSTSGPRTAPDEFVRAATEFAPDPWALAFNRLVARPAGPAAEDATLAHLWAIHVGGDR